MAHKTIILDPRIKSSGLVTLKSDHALSGPEVCQQFKLLLAMRGLENRSRCPRACRRNMNRCRLSPYHAIQVDSTRLYHACNRYPGEAEQAEELPVS